MAPHHAPVTGRLASLFLTSNRFPRLEKWARLGAFGVIIGMAIANVVWSLQTWPADDVRIYLAAGERILEGEPLYPGESAFRSYRYAPWFAWMWAGFSFLPFWVVQVVWQGALMVACIAVAIPFLRAGVYGWALGGLMVPLLFAVSAGGNVQALIVVSLLYGLDRRSGPLWIAIAASLRATPILFVAVYAARREWGRFWITLGLTAVLVAPMLLYDPLTLVTEVAGREPGLAVVSPVLYAVVALGSLGVLAYLAWKRSPYTLLGAAAGAVLASPKMYGYDLTAFLAVHPDAARSNAERTGGASAGADDTTADTRRR